MTTKIHAGRKNNKLLECYRENLKTFIQILATTFRKSIKESKLNIFDESTAEEKLMRQRNLILYVKLKSSI